MSNSSEPALRWIFDATGEKILIGSGGSGKVYLALWNGTPVAVKEPLTEVEAEDVLRESNVMEQVQDSPYVLQKVYHGPVEGAEENVLVTKFYQLGTLTETLKSLETPDTFWETRGISLVEHIILALNVVHQRGLVHLDVKPSNVLLEVSRGVESAILADFGSALKEHSKEKMLVTNEYAPPERSTATQPTNKFDIFAYVVASWRRLFRPIFCENFLTARLFYCARRLGVLIWEVWSGVPITSRILPNKSIVLISELSDEEKALLLDLDGWPAGCDTFRNLLLKMWAKEPGQRPYEMQDIWRTFTQEKRAGRLKGPDPALRKKRIELLLPQTPPHILKIVKGLKRDEETLGNTAALFYEAQRALFEQLPSVAEWEKLRTTPSKHRPATFTSFVQTRIAPAMEKFTNSIVLILNQIYTESKRKLGITFETCMASLDDLARGLLLPVSSINFGILYSPKSDENHAKCSALIEEIATRIGADSNGFLGRGTSCHVASMDDLLEMNGVAAQLQRPFIVRWCCSNFVAGSQGLHRILLLKLRQQLCLPEIKAGPSMISSLIGDRIEQREDDFTKLNSTARNKWSKMKISLISSIAEEAALDFVILAGFRVGYDFVQSIMCPSGKAPSSVVTNYSIVALRWIRALRQYRCIFGNTDLSADVELPSGLELPGTISRPLWDRIVNDEITFYHGDEDFSLERNIAGVVADGVARPLCLHTLRTILNRPASLKFTNNFSEAEKWMQDQWNEIQHNKRYPYNPGVVAALAASIMVRGAASDTAKRFYNSIEYAFRPQFIKDIHRLGRAFSRPEFVQFLVPFLSEIRNETSGNVALDMHMISFFRNSRADLLTSEATPLRIIVPDATCSYRSMVPTPQVPQYLKANIVVDLKLSQFDFSVPDTTRELCFEVSSNGRLYQLQPWPVWFGNELAFSYLLNLFFPGFFAPVCDVWTLVLPDGVSKKNKQISKIPLLVRQVPLNLDGTRCRSITHAMMDQSKLSLNKEWFDKLVIMSLLCNVTKADESNFCVQSFSDDNGLSHRLVYSFATEKRHELIPDEKRRHLPSVSSSLQGALFGPAVVGPAKTGCLRNLLFCHQYMLKPLPNALCEDILTWTSLPPNQHNPLCGKLLMGWAGDITNLNSEGRKKSIGMTDYELLTWMHSQPGKDLFPGDKFSSFLMASDCVENMIPRLYDAVDCVHLRRSSGFDIRPIDLLLAVHPAVAPNYLGPLQGNSSWLQRLSPACNGLSVATCENYASHKTVRAAPYFPKVDADHTKVRLDPANILDVIQLSSWKYLELTKDIFSIFQDPSAPVPQTFALLKRNLNAASDLNNRHASAALSPEYLAFIFGRLDWSQLSQQKQTQLFRHLQSWRSALLRLRGCSSLSDQILQSTLQNARSAQLVTTIDLTGCQSLSNAVVALLGHSCGQLRGLVMNDCVGITTFVTAATHNPFERLERLELKGCKNLTRVEGEFPRLMYLLLGECPQLVALPLTAPKIVTLDASAAKDSVCHDISVLILQAAYLTSVAFPQNVHINPNQLEAGVTNIGDISKCPAAVRTELIRLLASKRREPWQATAPKSAARLAILNSPSSLNLNNAITQIVHHIRHFLFELDISGAEDVDSAGLSQVVHEAKYLRVLKAQNLPKLTSLSLRGYKDSSTGVDLPLELQKLNLSGCSALQTLSIQTICPNLTEIDLQGCMAFQRSSLRDDHQIFSKIPRLRSIRMGQAFDVCVVAAELATSNRSAVEAIELVDAPDVHSVFVAYSDGSLECRRFPEKGDPTTLISSRAHSARITRLFQLAKSNSHTIAAVSCGADGTIALWKSSGQKVIPRLSKEAAHRPFLASMTLSRATDSAATNSPAATSMSRLALEPSSNQLHSGPITAMIEFKPGVILTAGWDRVMRLLTLNGEAIQNEMLSEPVHFGCVTAIVKINDTMVATACHDGKIRVWHVGDDGFKLLSSVDDEHGPAVGTIGLWAHQKQFLVAAGHDDVLNVYKLPTDLSAPLALVCRLGCPPQIADIVSLGKFIVGGCNESHLLLWEVDGSRQGVLQPDVIDLDYGSHIFCEKLHLLSCGLILVHCSDSTMRLVDFVSRRVIRSLTLQSRSSTSCELINGQIALIGKDVVLIPQGILKPAK